MKSKFLIPLIIICSISCSSDKEDIVFDKTKWNTKEGKDYPYRSQMLNDIVYNDTIRELNKKEILNLLGEPSYERDDEDYLHYMINQKRLFSWPLHTRVMVVKFKDEETIDWIKIHE